MPLCGVAKKKNTVIQPKILEKKKKSGIQFCPSSFLEPVLKFCNPTVHENGQTFTKMEAFFSCMP